MTALENVEIITEIAEQPMRAADALALVGLQERAAIARAVAKRPDVLLCDEPTGALDYETGKLVLKVLQDVNRELGTTTAVITHNAAIAGMADRACCSFLPCCGGSGIAAIASVRR